MAINKYVRAAVKLVSHMEVDIKTNYKLLRQMERIARRPPVKPTYHLWEDYTNDRAGKCTDIPVPVRVFMPDGMMAKAYMEWDAPFMLFFHGGGWVTGELDTYEKTCRNIANQTGHILMAADYRLAPEHPFPAALEDCYQVVRATRQRLEKSGSKQAIILMGDSAGGNLAAAVSLYMRDRGEKPAEKQILIYPVTYNDHTETTPFLSNLENGTDYILTSKRISEYMDLYCACAEDRKSPYLAPLLAEDLSGQPETLIITAQYDPLRDEGEAYGHRLEASGNRVTIHRMADVLHGYFSLPLRFSAVKDTYALINDFLRQEGGTAYE